jgi:hypothetical protein
LKINHPAVPIQEQAVPIQEQVTALGWERASGGLIEVLSDAKASPLLLAR